MQTATTASTNIGAFIRKARLEKGFSQKKLASKIGLTSGQNISNWESGGIQPRLSYLKKVCKVLDIDPAKVETVLVKQYAREVAREMASYS